MLSDVLPAAPRLVAQAYGAVPAVGSAGMASVALRRRAAMGGLALLAAVVLASCVAALSGAGSPAALEQGAKVDWQALLAANPGMTPEEAQQQAQLMEEGSITLDPNSENPSADFYANSEADIGDNDDVEDAGPGNHLGGWYCRAAPPLLHAVSRPLLRPLCVAGAQVTDAPRAGPTPSCWTHPRPRRWNHLSIRPTIMRRRC